jgi:hypothetical protein
MKRINLNLWIRVALFNLLIVAFLGTIMRYKIGFSFPFLSQKNLQHAHSHFAFAGWITHILFVLMVDTLLRDRPALNLGKYRMLIIANLACAYGMLISFAIQGYGVVSISLSCASIFVAYAFAFTFFSDLRHVRGASYRMWFTAALWFNIISSVGTFTLGFMMATHNFDQQLHLASLYYYLHFQYNGFFMFACLGLLVSHVKKVLPSYRHDPAVFWMFFLSCIPAYFLSVLWSWIPGWLFVIVVLAAAVQVVAWGKFLFGLRRAFRVKETFTRMGFYLLVVVGAALSAKLLLQLGSVIPALSKLAFGFRPVVIAYLHLILLAIITVFLITYLHVFGFLRSSRSTRGAIVLFVVGVYLNELVLGIQGVASFSYTMVPFVNEMLFVIAVLILMALAWLFLSQRKKTGGEAVLQ